MQLAVSNLTAVTIGNNALQKIKMMIYSLHCINMQLRLNFIDSHKMKGSVPLSVPFFRFLELFCFVFVVLEMSLDLLEVAELGFVLLEMLSVKSFTDSCCLFVHSGLSDLVSLLSKADRCAS